MMSINKISNTSYQKMVNSSVARLPAHPSASGYTEVDIRNAQFNPILMNIDYTSNENSSIPESDRKTSLFMEINRIVGEVNEVTSGIRSDLTTSQQSITTLDGNVYKKSEVDTMFQTLNATLTQLVTRVNEIGTVVEELATTSDISYTFEDIGD